VTINVTNNPPTATPDTYSILHDRVLYGSPGVLSNDTDSDLDLLVAGLVQTPSNGRIEFYPQGEFYYYPNPGFVGTDTFTYIVSDGAAIVPATVNINVTNNPPTATPDTYSVLEDQVLYGSPGVLNNDTDSDFDLLVAGLVQGPSNGQIDFYSQGDFYYYPNPGFVGTDTFTYIVSDGAAIVPATVTINVINNPPTATPDTYSLSAAKVLSVIVPGVLGNDSDSDLNTLTAAVAANPTKGSIALNQDGSFAYTPNAGFSGIAVDGWSNRTGPINLNIAPTSPGSAGTDKLTETANNTLKGEPGEDLLTGGTGAGTLILPFAESSVSASVPGTDLAIDKKRDPLTEGGAAFDAPSLFSPATDSPVPTLVKNLSPVFTEANGALVGNPPLGINSAPFDVANTSPFLDPYLVGVSEAKQSLGISVA
jgi:hypothetical protein